MISLNAIKLLLKFLHEEKLMFIKLTHQNEKYFGYTFHSNKQILTKVFRQLELMYYYYIHYF